MNNWQRWLKAPQTHWFRKTLFQIHLWSGLITGFYILTISLTGSAILLQPYVIQLFASGKIESTETLTLKEDALKGQALEEKLSQVYSDFEVYFTVPAYKDDRATYVVLHKGSEVFPRYFDQYSGTDIGPSNPWQVKLFEWLVDIHDDLLMDRIGRKINGAGAGVIVLMAMTGLILWWQGRSRWQHGLQIKRGSLHSFNWQLHSFIGFWTFLLFLTWGTSGLYLGFPREFSNAMTWIGAGNSELRGPGPWIRFLLDIHYARLGDTQWAHWSWITLSFLPSIMVISGIIIWLKRVILNPH